MLKLLPARLHAYLDYVVVFALAFAPAVFALSRGAPRLACYVVAMALFLAAVFSGSPLGPERMLPAYVHAVGELVCALALAAAPWLLRFAHDLSDRNFFLGAGGLVFLLWLVSDYREEAPSS